LARRYAERSWAPAPNLDHAYPLKLVARQKTATAQAGRSAFARTVMSALGPSRQLAACNDRVALGQSGHEWTFMSTRLSRFHTILHPRRLYQRAIARRGFPTSCGARATGVRYHGGAEQEYQECQHNQVAQRSPGHHRLLRLGFIAEHPVSLKNLLITVTAAGRTAIGCRPAEYVGTHPTLWGRIPPDSSETPAHYERAP
jgi:hypothetical protein